MENERKMIEIKENIKHKELEGKKQLKEIDLKKIWKRIRRK